MLHAHAHTYTHTHTFKLDLIDYSLISKELLNTAFPDSHMENKTMELVHAQSRNSLRGMWKLKSWKDVNRGVGQSRKRMLITSPIKL